MLCLLCAPCVHAAEMHGSSSESGVVVIELEVTGDCADNATGITHSAHTCCGEHSSCIILEKINVSSFKPTTVNFVFNDLSKAAAIVEPALEPPTA